MPSSLTSESGRGRLLSPRATQHLQGFPQQGAEDGHRELEARHGAQPSEGVLEGGSSAHHVIADKPSKGCGW